MFKHVQCAKTGVFIERDKKNKNTSDGLMRKYVYFKMIFLQEWIWTAHESGDAQSTGTG